MTGGPFCLDNISGKKFRKHSASSGKVFKAQSLVCISFSFIRCSFLFFVFFLGGGGGFLFWLMCHNEILAFVFATRNEKYYVKIVPALLHRTCMRRCHFERKDKNLRKKKNCDCAWTTFSGKWREKLKALSACRNRIVQKEQECLFQPAGIKKGNTAEWSPICSGKFPVEPRLKCIQTG